MLTAIFPLSLRAVTLGDYTRHRFTLGGTLGIGLEDYAHQSGEYTFEREGLKTEVGLNGSGFVWDPRFLSFSAGVTLLEDEQRTTDGESDYSTVGYHLNTTWFGHRRHPLSIYADKGRNSVSEYYAPSYDLDTQRIGAHWGLSGRWFGDVRISYDTLNAESDNVFVPRDESSEVLSAEGRRRIERDSGTNSEITYGYRFNESEDVAIGALQRQHYWYAYDQTRIGDDVNISSNVTYYDRQDVWQEQGGSEVDPSDLRNLNTTFFSFNSGLTERVSEVAHHFYSVSLSRSDVESSRTDTYTLRGGLVNRVHPEVELHASAGFNGSRFIGETTDTRTSGDLESGIRYQKSYDAVYVNSSYVLGFRRAFESPEGNLGDDAVQQTVTFGLGRRDNPVYQDSVDYRVSTQQGDKDIYEHNLRYAASSRISAWDSLQSSAEYRHYREQVLEDVKTERTSANARLSMSWTHRIGAGSVVTLTAARSKADSDGAWFERSHVQGRITAALHSRRNLRVSGLTSWEEEVSSSGVRLEKISVEANAIYTFGRWDSSLEYRYRDIDGEPAVPIREQSIMLYLRRNFQLRF